MVSGFLLFYRLGVNHLSNWDEAWLAAISRTMLQSGNYLTPIWNTQVFFDKPPFYYWASAIAMKIFGINEFSARLPSALAGVGTVWLVYLLTKLWFKQKSTALTASLILISTIGFLYRSRTGNLDTFLTFWIMLAIWAYYRLLKPKSESWTIWFMVGLVGAFLTKGLIALVFPVVVVVWGLIRPQQKLLPRQFHWGVSGAVVIGLGWLGVNAVVNGPDYLNYFLGHQAEKTFARWQIWQTFSWDYLGYLRSGLKLWIIPAVPSLVYAWWRLRKHPAYPAVVYVTGMLIGLSFFANKSNWFLVPLYPLIAIITSYGIWEIGGIKLKLKILKFKLRERTFIITAILVAISAWQLYHYREQYLTPDVAADEAKVALAAKQLTNSGDTLYLTHYYCPTTVYYSERRVLAVYSEQESNRAWYILPKTAWPEITKLERLFVVTTREEWGFLQDYLPSGKFTVLAQSGEKLLLAKKR